MNTNNNLNSTGQDDLTRLSVNINSATREVMEDRKYKEGMSYTEQVRHAVSVYDFVYKEVAKGGKVLVQQADGTYLELMFPDV